MSGATTVYKAFAFDTLGLETKLVDMTPVDLKQHEVRIQSKPSPVQFVTLICTLAWGHGLCHSLWMARLGIR